MVVEVESAAEDPSSGDAAARGDVRRFRIFARGRLRVSAHERRSRSGGHPVSESVCARDPLQSRHRTARHHGSRKTTSLASVAGSQDARSMIAAARRILARLRRPARTSSSQQRDIFTAIFRRNDWGHPDSVSGPGSTIERGLQFRDEFVKVLRDVEIKSILDAPCGDFNWMRLVLDDLDVEYTGVDIVEALVRENAARDARQFRCLDFTPDELPRADAVLCRDELVHLSLADIRETKSNFER